MGKVDLPTFLQQKLAPKKGNIHEILPTWPKYVREEVPAEGEPTTGQLAALAEPWRYTCLLYTSRQVLVPAVEEFIARIDFEGRTMHLVLPEGLLTLE